MFFDHGNHGGALIGLLLLALGFNGLILWIGFALAWILTAYPDLAQFLRNWFFSFKWEDSFDGTARKYNLQVSFTNDSKVKDRFHVMNEFTPFWIRWNPLFALHRFADSYAHSGKAMTDRAYALNVYLVTALSGWIGVALLITLSEVLS